MRKIITAVASVTAIAVLVVPALASADVQRYQTTDSMTWVTHAYGADIVHNYTLNYNPCVSNSFTGTAPGETIQGTFSANGDITIQGQYAADSGYPGYTWHYNGPLSGGGQSGDSMNLTWDATVTPHTSSYKNHGQYVSASGGGDDAAHSCIGMPIQSSK